MSYYVMVGKGIPPISPIDTIYDEDLEDDMWMEGEPLDFTVEEPIMYDLDSVDKGQPKLLYDEEAIPVMHNSLYNLLISLGVDNIQVYDAVLRDIDNGIEYTDYKAFNVVGLVSAADMEKSIMMGTSNSAMIDADFDRLYIDEKKCLGRLIFRLAENVSAIVVHQRIKDQVEKIGLQGIFFYPNGEWSG